MRAFQNKNKRSQSILVDCGPLRGTLGKTCQGKPDELLGSNLQYNVAYHLGGVAILLVNSCYRNHPRISSDMYGSPCPGSRFHFYLAFTHNKWKQTYISVQEYLLSLYQAICLALAAGSTDTRYGSDLECRCSLVVLR